MNATGPASSDSEAPGGGTRDRGASDGGAPRAGEFRRPTLAQAPALRVFVADAEASWGGSQARRDLHRALERDLGLLAGMLGGDSDVVLVPNDGEATSARRARLVSSLRQLGLPCATPVSCDRDAYRIDDSAAARAVLQGVSRLAPWAWTQPVARLLRPSVGRLGGAPAEEDMQRWVDAGRALGDKGAVPGLREALGAAGGALVQDLAGLLAFWRGAEAAGEAIVCKARHGSSGRDALRLLPGRGEPTTVQLGWLRRQLATHGGVVIERWWPRIADLGRLYLPSPAAEGGLRALPPHQSLCDARGGFRGVAFGPDAQSAALAALSPPTDAAWLPRLDAALRARWADAGFDARAEVGVGVDLIVQAGGPQQPAPWPVEINARFTLGHVAAALSEAVATGASGRLWLLSAADARTAGVPLAALAERLETQWPRTLGSSGLQSGAVALAVGEGAAMMPMLLIAPSEEALAERWRAIAGADLIAPGLLGTRSDGAEAAL